MANDNRKMFELLRDTPNVRCTKCDTKQIAQIVTLNPSDKYHIKCFNCLSCTQTNIEIYWSATELKGKGQFSTPEFKYRAIFRYPPAQSKFKIPTTCPAEIQEDYSEAARLLAMSPRASAAFARRCLEAVLSAQGYKQKQLHEKIDAVLKETDPRKILPYYISKNIDAVRGFGNFSAHPIVNKATAEITDVQPGEAEWCIQIIQELLDHYYTRPAEEQAKIDQINEKLVAAGKPPIKAPKEAE
jgi:hypothetical protein